MIRTFLSLDFEALHMVRWTLGSARADFLAVTLTLPPSTSTYNDIITSTSQRSPLIQRNLLDHALSSAVFDLEFWNAIQARKVLNVPRLHTKAGSMPGTANSALAVTPVDQWCPIVWTLCTKGIELWPFPDNKYFSFTEIKLLHTAMTYI